MFLTLRRLPALHAAMWGAGQGRDDVDTLQYNRTVAGRNPFRTALKPWSTIPFVGIYQWHQISETIPFTIPFTSETGVPER